MDNSVGIETLRFQFEGSQQPPTGPSVLVGVVGSGNLEILFEYRDSALCEFEIHTSARGFGHIWEAVCKDFHQRHPFTGVLISIHDMGATPAVVSLRLEQAVSEAQSCA